MKNAKIKEPRSTRTFASILAVRIAVLIGVTLAVYAGFTAYYTYIIYQQNLAAQQQLIAQDSSKTISNFVQEKFNRLETAMGVANPITANAEARQITLESLLGEDPSFRQLVLLDSSGQQLEQVSRSTQILSAQFSAQLHGEVLSQTSKVQRYVSSVYIDDTTSEPLIAIAVPVKDVFGDYQGTLMAEVNLKFMWDLVDQIKVGKTGYAFIVDRDGNLIAFGDTSRVLAHENIQHLNEVQEFLENPTGVTDLNPGIASSTGLLGTPVLGTYAPLGTPDWAVVIELPMSEANQTVWQILLINVIAVLACSILGGLSGLLLARLLTAPLIALSAVASKVAGGSLEVVAKVVGPAEVIQVSSAFNIMISRLRDLVGNLESRVAERTSELETRTTELTRISSQMEQRATQLQTIALVAQTITSIQRLDRLLPRVTTMISEQFGFYHVGIFLLDEAKSFVVLAATNSPGGQKMLERGHKLKVGETGIVGYVAFTGRSRIALDTSADAAFFNNPDLPETRSEMALPLRIGNETIGVLDVQSKQSAAFVDEDVELLAVLADQVSVAIQNARSFDEAQRALTEAEATARQYLQQEWKTAAEEATTTGYRYTKASLLPLTQPVDTPAIKKASQSGQASTETEAGQNYLAVPIKLRGQIVGVLNLQSGRRRKWGQDEIDIVQATADRVALALENARLLESSQDMASRERAIGEITSKIGASINLRSVLQTAVEELGRVMPGSDVIIQLENGKSKE